MNGDKAPAGFVAWFLFCAVLAVAMTAAVLWLIVALAQLIGRQ